MTLDALLSRLHGVRRSGSGYVALCEAHQDANPSLSIREGDDGRVLVHCHSGCSTENLLSALGLSWPDLFADSPSGKPHRPRRAQSPLEEARARVLGQARRSLRKLAPHKHAFPLADALRDLFRAVRQARSEATAAGPSPHTWDLLSAAVALERSGWMLELALEAP